MALVLVKGRIVGMGKYLYECPVCGFLHHDVHLVEPVCPDCSAWAENILFGGVR